MRWGRFMVESLIGLAGHGGVGRRLPASDGWGPIVYQRFGDATSTSDPSLRAGFPGQLRAEGRGDLEIGSDWQDLGHLLWMPPAPRGLIAQRGT